MKKKKRTTIFKLQTTNWNKQTKSNQDKALLFMYRVLGELSEKRKFGYANDFSATF